MSEQIATLADARCYPGHTMTTYRADMTPTEFRTAAVALGKRQIRGDIASSRVSANVSDFSQLHDFVDANCYGDFCDDGLNPIFGAIFPHNDGEDTRLSAGFMDAAECVQNELDAWIRAGTPAP